MGLKDDIKEKVDTLIDENYSTTDGYIVPGRDSVTFGATAKKIFARVLYIDIRGSRDLLSDHQHITVLKAHKAFLYAVTKCIRAEGGEPRNFSGDSVLAFWVGSSSDNAKQAVRAAMKARFVLDYILNPKLEQRYGDRLDFGIGIGQGDVFVGKSGIGGDANFQDLIWIGWSVYHAVSYGDKAAKPYAIWISKNVYSAIKDDSNMTIGSDGKNMWVYRDESLPIGTFTVYKTSYHWKIT
jgi:adenylate cyclase